MAWVYRGVSANSFIGTVPTELGTLTALAYLCVPSPHPPRLHACTVTGLWAERGGGLGCRMLHANSFTGPLPTELGTMDALTDLCVRRPSPTRAWTCAPSPGCG